MEKGKKGWSRCQLNYGSGQRTQAPGASDTPQAAGACIHGQNYLHPPTRTRPRRIECKLSGRFASFLREAEDGHSGGRVTRALAALGASAGSI
jgi:hypothetical protein